LIFITNQKRFIITAYLDGIIWETETTNSKSIVLRKYKFLINEYKISKHGKIILYDNKNKKTMIRRK
jgi:hypothetical protein